MYSTTELLHEYRKIQTFLFDCLFPGGTISPWLSISVTSMVNRRKAPVAINRYVCFILNVLDLIFRDVYFLPKVLFCESESAIHPFISMRRWKRKLCKANIDDSIRASPFLLKNLFKTILLRVLCLEVKQNLSRIAQIMYLNRLMVMFLFLFSFVTYRWVHYVVHSLRKLRYSLFDSFIHSDSKVGPNSFAACVMGNIVEIGC